MGKLEPKPEPQSFQEDLEADDEIEILEVVGVDENGLPVEELAGPPYEDDSDDIVLDFDADDTGMEEFMPSASQEEVPQVGPDVGREDRERLLRLHADFENFKKRVERDQGQQERQAGARLIERLLPVLDNFERAVAATPADPADRAVLDGVVLIFKQMLKELRAEGLVAVDSVGETFDPTVHEAVATDDNEALPSNTVVEELLRGYMLHGRLLRAALVKVNRPEDLGPGQEANDGGYD